MDDNRGQIALGDVLRSSLQTAERFEALGGGGAGDSIRRQLEALDDGEPITVPSWQLAAALDALGAPTSVARDVLASDYVTVRPDGTWSDDTAAEPVVVDE